MGLRSLALPLIFALIALSLIFAAGVLIGHQGWTIMATLIIVFSTTIGINAVVIARNGGKIVAFERRF